MINSDYIVAGSLLLLLALVLLLAYLFRVKLVAWDKKLAENIKTYVAKQRQAESFWSGAPGFQENPEMQGCSYHVRTISPNDLVIEEQMFSAFSKDLGDCVSTVTYLRDMANGMLDKDKKPKQKEKFFGVG